MSEKSPFSNFDHIGIVVRDIHKAVEYYESLGLGPFIEHQHGNVDFKWKKMWGKPVPIDFYGLERRLGRVGQTQAELLQPAWGQGPWMEFLDTKGEGINHLAFVVDDIDGEESKLAAKGFTVMFSARYKDSGGVSYFDTRGVGGFIVELIEWPPGMQVDLPEPAEKSSFSNLDHVGIIVRDLDKAVEYYESIGIGPFKVVGEMKRLERRVMGKVIDPDSIQLTERMARAGQMKYELLQHVRGESFWKEFLETRGEGIQHLGFCVDDFEKEMAKLEEKGCTVMYSTKFQDGGGSAYLDTSEVGGVLIQLAQWAPGMAEDIL
ncbi:VOC family protein [Chloroflexota bacterium]